MTDPIRLKWVEKLQSLADEAHADGALSVEVILCLTVAALYSKDEREFSHRTAQVALARIHEMQEGAVTQ